MVEDTRGVSVPFFKEPGTRLKNRFRARWCLDMTYLSFYNKPLPVSENRGPTRVPDYQERGIRRGPGSYERGTQVPGNEDPKLTTLEDISN